MYSLNPDLNPGKLTKFNKKKKNLIFWLVARNKIQNCHILIILRLEILSGTKRKRKIRVWCGAHASPREWRTGVSQWACSCTFLVPSFRKSKVRSWRWFLLRSRSVEKLLLVFKLFFSQMISFFFLGVLFGQNRASLSFPSEKAKRKPYVLIWRGNSTVWMLGWERERERAGAFKLSEFWVVITESNSDYDPLRFWPACF